MNLVTWNCCGGFGGKVGRLMALQPDIAVLQEVRNSDLSSLDSGGSVVWAGIEGKKGVAVVGLNGWRLERQQSPDDKWFVPVIASRGEVRLQVVGVWAAHADGYVAPALRALTRLQELFRGRPSIIAGDFNANVGWDKGRSPARRFSELLKLLDGLGLGSAWHRARDEDHGSETEPTIFHRWSEAKPYHVDYAFASEDLLAGLTEVRLGRYEDWTGAKISDHVPLVASFRLPT